jgi:hypothetical protein
MRTHSGSRSHDFLEYVYIQYIGPGRIPSTPCRLWVCVYGGLKLFRPHVPPRIQRIVGCGNRGNLDRVTSKRKGCKEYAPRYRGRVFKTSTIPHASSTLIIMNSGSPTPLPQNCGREFYNQKKINCHPHPQNCGRE